MAVTEHGFDDTATSALALAKAIASILREGLDQRGEASLVVSGGKSPVPFFLALRDEVLDWSRVVITLADERWVDPASEESNEHLVRRHLLQQRAAAARFVSLKAQTGSPAEALAEIAARLAVVPRPYDAVVLGMGDDGHTASLFPGSPGLDEALDPTGVARVAATMPQAGAHPRITLTAAALLDARRIFVSIAGEAKRKVYEAAKGGAAVDRHPIGIVLRQETVPVAVLIAG